MPSSSSWASLSICKSLKCTKRRHSLLSIQLFKQKVTCRLQDLRSRRHRRKTIRSFSKSTLPIHSLPRVSDTTWSRLLTKQINWSQMRLRESLERNSRKDTLRLTTLDWVSNQIRHMTWCLRLAHPRTLLRELVKLLLWSRMNHWILIILRQLSLWSLLTSISPISMASFSGRESSRTHWPSKAS